MTSISDLANKNKGTQLTNAETMAMTAKDAGMGTVKSFFEKNRSAISAVAPKHISPDRLLKIALGAIRQNPKLQDCDVSSLMGAAILCGSLGLEPNTVLQEAFLIPFTTNKKVKQGNKWVDEKRIEVQFILGYRGLLNLARRSGQINSISARVVYSSDIFEINYGTNEGIIHKPNIVDRGEIIGAYATAILKNGSTQFEFMSKQEIDAIRDASQGYQKDEWVSGQKTGKKVINESSPWHKNYDQMAKKTLLRRLCNYLPSSIEMAQAIQTDSLGEAQSQNLDKVLEGEYSIQYEDEIESSENINKLTGEILEPEVINN